MSALLRTLAVTVLTLAPATACLKIPPDVTQGPEGAASAPSTAAEVIDRHINAIGGRTKLEDIDQRTLEARIVFRAQESCEEGAEGCISKDEAGSFILMNGPDGKMYRRMLVGSMVEERGFDGHAGWRMGSGGPLRVDSPQEVATSREDALLHWYFDIEARGIETQLMKSRKEDSEGNALVLDGVRWGAPGTTSKEMWFNRATGLLHEESVREGEGDNERGEVIRYDDYREVDGILIPHAITVTSRVGDQAQVVEFTTQRVHHDKIEASRFELPKLEAPKPEIDKLLAELTTARTDAKANPKDAASQMAHARLAYAAAHFDEAKPALKATLAADAKEPEALFTLARIQILQGELSAAAKTLARAERAGIKPAEIARQRAWIHHRRRDYPKLAKALDAGKNPVLAGFYRAFVGRPVDTKIGGNGCSTEVPMITNDPLAIVEIEVGGKKVGAIIDSGASDLIITQELATELKVPVRAKSSLGEGMPDVGHGELSEFKVGTLSIKNVAANVYDAAALAEMAGPDAARVQAVLGLSVLSKFAIVMDLPKGAMRLISQDRKCAKQREAALGTKSAPMWVHETHYLYVMAKINDAEGVYLINTGMRGADMTATELAYGHAGIGSPVMRGNNAPMVEVRSLTVGGDALQVTNLTSAFGYFNRTRTTDGFRLDGMLGLRAFGGKPFALDYSRGRIYFPGG